VPISPEAAHYRAIIAGKKRAIRNGERPADDPELIDAQRGLKAATTADYIEKVLSQAPPLSGEQRNRLAELLRPARRGGAA
jgi:hypothetical protein